MGFGSIIQPSSSSGGTTEKSSFELCLSDARSSASDGDFYKDGSSGQLWAFWKPADTPGFLIPSHMYGKLTILSTAGAGKCYVASDDTLSYDSGSSSWVGTLVNRGWSVAASANTSMVKTASNALEITHPTISGGWGSGYIYWPNDGSTPFVSTKRYFMMLKIAIVSASNYPTHQSFWINTNDSQKKLMRCSTAFYASDEGWLNWLNGAALRGDSGFTVSTNPRWLMATFGAYDSAAKPNDMCSVQNAQDPIMIASANRHDFAAGSGSNVIPFYSGSNSTSYSAEVHGYEMFCAEVSA